MDKSLNNESWSGVAALTLGISSLMMAQFLPSGLLTPMASHLQITEGMAGQTVTLTSVFAVIASLLNSYLTKSFNRKYVLVALSFMVFVSCLIVAITDNFTIVLFGRALLGIAIGGYWAMSTAIAFRLVTAENTSKALSIIFGGASFAGMLSAPMGSFLGEIVGWQNVFLLNAILGLIAFVWLIISMPSLAPNSIVKLRTTLDVLKVDTVKVGLVAIFTSFCGRYASLTYLRPFVENELGLSTNYVSILFLIFDTSYFVGTFYAAKAVANYRRKTMYLPQLALGILSFGLIIFAHDIYIIMGIILLSGLAFANIPITWSSWGPLTVPEQAETIGGLFVASTQASSAFGALAGGLIFDRVGSVGVFSFSGIVWLFSSILVVFFLKDKFSLNQDNNEAQLVDVGGSLK